jgi:apolipoprotein N-acyltransferase
VNWPRGVAMSATVLSAAVYVLAFPPFGWSALAWVALVPLLVALRSGALGSRLFLGALWTLGSGLGLGSWMPAAVAHYTQQPVLVGWLFLLGLTVFTAAPFYMAFAAVYRPVSQLRGGPLFAAAALTAAELARSRLLNGSPIYFGVSPGGSLGYSQAGVLPVVQVAAWTGVYGVSFALALMNAALADAFVAWREGGLDRRAALGLALAGAVAVGVVASGAAALRDAENANGPDAVEIALVQANLDPISRWGERGPYNTLEVHLRMTRELLAEHPPAIVFWPEAAVTFLLEQETLYRSAIAGLLATSDTELVVGALRSEGPDGPPYRNSIYLMDGTGEIRGRYDKEYLLPFMEYFPIGIDMLRRSFGHLREFSPGDQTGPLATRAGKAGILVCNEGMLPQFAAERVAAGAEYLVNPSNDGWIPHPSYLGQQFDMVALRAVEQRSYLVRVSDVGPSAIIDPWGRVQGRTEPLTRAVLRGRIRPASERSLYGRTGDLFALLCVLATAVGLAWARRSSAQSLPASSA